MKLSYFLKSSTSVFCNTLVISNLKEKYLKKATCRQLTGAGGRVITENTSE